jgi:hypothetical protein
MRVTAYDVVTAVMISAVVGLVATVVALVIIWLTNLRPSPQTPPVLELLELPGGFEDGAIDETLKVDSEEELREDPAVADNPSEETEVMETLESVEELSDQATQIAQQQFEPQVSDSGTPGRATGNGRRPLGAGGPGSGVPRDQRWYIRFSDRGTVSTYAKQLDFFKIELGALTQNQLIYIKNVSTKTPGKRSRNTGKDEKRLYMNWQGGDRRTADVALFKKAGVDAKRALIFHFYAPATEQLLAKLELDHAKRPVKQIRRTYFVVRREGSGFKFVVTRQLFFR